MSIEGKIREITPSLTEPACYLFEVELPRENLRNASADISGRVHDQIPSDCLKFSLCSDLVNSMPPQGAARFLQNMTFKHMEKGERFITQGGEADQFYIVLRGSCIVLMEKDNMMYRIAQLGAGDIVGEMAVFTGERRGAHVDAETDLDVLSMSRGQFENLSQEFPELRTFLSEIVTHRLSTSTIMAEKKIGKYTITEKIGDGGSSIVYRGTHSMLNMPVTIKMLKHEMAMDRDFIEVFLNEAKVIAQLNHPHIVKVFDIEELYRTVFIIMEYLEGTTLKNILKAMMKLSISRILDITLQVCFGLEYAHKHGIIHQDINPSNIFLQSNGQAKIIDFGIACKRGSVDINNLFPGTLHYIPPEQIRGDPVDERADIYSLGTTVYEMLTGRLPFPGDDARTVFNRHLNEDIHDTRATIPDLPDELHTFLMRTIRKDPAVRYKNVSEILDGLQPLAEKLEVKVEPRFCVQNKMIGMFLVYQEEQQLALKRLIEEFNRNIGESGAVLKVTQFEDL